MKMKWKKGLERQYYLKVEDDQKAKYHQATKNGVCDGQTKWAGVY